MKIILTEQQVKKITNQTGFTVDEIVSTLWGAVVGPGTNEQLFYGGIDQIKSLDALKKVSDSLLKQHGEDFYSLVNGSLEFTDSEQEEIVSILNRNNLPHKIVNGKIISLSNIKTSSEEPEEDSEEKQVVRKITNYKDLIKKSLKFRKEIVACTLIDEAKGESDPKAFKAVLSVLKNRTEKMPNLGKTMAEQALFPYQFSGWNRIQRTISGIKNHIEEAKKEPRWDEAMSLVNQSVSDVTRGATHYYAYKGKYAIPKEKIKRDPNLAWIKTMKNKTPIGNHLFGSLA